MMKEGNIADIFTSPIFKDSIKYALITDTNIKRLYAKELSRLPKNISVLTIRAGEKSKSLSTIEKLTSELVALNFTKRDSLISLGGGVVGDITGLLAALYMRGVSHIQIPTTLLAMCDSSIGGKNGVNTAEGKNLLGTIRQPHVTFVQPYFLKTLPESELKNGLAECVKCGATMSKKLFTYLEKNYQAILAKDPAALNTIIIQTRSLKTKIVESDPEEYDIRKILNYGHTIGHTIEKASNFTVHHGAAISIGMHLENMLGLNKKIVQKKVVERVQNLLMKIGLPTALPQRYKKLLTPYLSRDKKRTGNHITMYLPETLGTSKPYEITLPDLEAVLI